MRWWKNFLDITSGKAFPPEIVWEEINIKVHSLGEISPMKVYVLCYKDEVLDIYFKEYDAYANYRWQKSEAGQSDPSQLKVRTATLVFDNEEVKTEDVSNAS